MPYELWPDVVFAVVALLAIYNSFLRAWPLWEDQSIYEYMASGLKHGLVLYRDAINMNWPGAVLVHLVGQAIGEGGPGLRIVECVLLGVLCLSSSAVLLAFRVSAPVRVVALGIFLGTYFDLGYEHTAQRESFLVAFLAPAVLPFLSTTARRAPCERWVWFLGGAAAGASISIKPTAVLFLFGVSVCAVVLWNRADRGALVRSLASYTVGAFAVGVAMLLFLAIWGDIRGFAHWGIGYAFGPYARVAYTPEQRIQHIAAHFSSAPRESPMWALLLFVKVAVAGFLLSGTGLVSRALVRGERMKSIFEVALTRGSVALVLVTSAFLSLYLQGKTHTGYHFIPLHWALCVGGAILLGGVLFDHQPRASQWGSVFAALALLFFHFRAQSENRPPPRQTVLADALRARMRPDDTVVLFGFVPSLLCDLNLARPTPFAFVDSWIMYAASGEGSAYRREILGNWRSALADPHTRFFLVHHGLRLGTNGGELSDQIVAEQFPAPTLSALGYKLISHLPGSGGFSIYERRR